MLKVLLFSSLQKQYQLLDEEEGDMVNWSPPGFERVTALGRNLCIISRWQAVKSHYLVSIRGAQPGTETTVPTSERVQRKPWEIMENKTGKKFSWVYLEKIFIYR